MGTHLRSGKTVHSFFYILHSPSQSNISHWGLKHQIFVFKISSFVHTEGKTNVYTDLEEHE